MNGACYEFNSTASLLFSFGSFFFLFTELKNEENKMSYFLWFFRNLSTFSNLNKFLNKQTILNKQILDRST